VEEDVVELGGGWSPRLPGWRPPRGAGLLAAVVLAAALGGGYAVHLHGTAASRPQVRPTVSTGAAEGWVPAGGAATQPAAPVPTSDQIRPNAPSMIVWAAR
jgi:hypothetical protein